MKRNTWLLVVILLMATGLFAKQKEEQKETMGTVCNSACVVPQNELPTCDTTCTDRSGDVVFVDDAGKVTKIANPDMAMPHMRKRVKATFMPKEKDREELLRIKAMEESAP